MDECQMRVGHDYRITVRLVRLRDFFVVGGFAEDVLVLAVVLGERGNKGVDFGRCHVAAEFAVGGELFQQAALAGGGGGFQILALGLFGFLGAVGRAVFTLCLMYFGFPFDLCFLESLFLGMPLAVVVLLGSVEQTVGKGHYSLSRCGRGYDGIVEVRRIEGVLIEEADIRKNRAATVKAAQQYDVALTRVGRVAYAVLQQLGQHLVDALGNVRRLCTKFVVFFQQIFFVGLFIGRLGGVIKGMSLALTPFIFFRFFRK